MDFEFSEEQTALQHAVRRVLDDHVTSSDVRDAYRDGKGNISSAWQALSAMGVVGVLLPQEFGGLGASMVDAAAILEELGRCLAPLPFVGSAITAATSLFGGAAIAMLQAAAVAKPKC